MYFLTTNQLFSFSFDIDKVIRQTYTHAHMHTNIHIHRYTYILAHMHEFIHKIKPPLIIPSTTDNRKTIFIHPGYFYSASLSPLLLRGQRRSRIQQLTLHAEALQVTVSERLTCPRSKAWRLESNSNPRPSGSKALTQPMCHHAPRILTGNCKKY